MSEMYDHKEYRDHIDHDYETDGMDQGPLSLETAAHDAAIADGLISSSKGMESKGKKAGLRRGKWTTEEELYANRLIQEFKAGLLPLTDGTTLRTFLSKLLNCDPMRISKKFVGQNCIGKQVFRRRQQDLDKLTAEHVERCRRELAELERKFLERVAQTNRTKTSSGGMKNGKGYDETGLVAPWMRQPDEFSDYSQMVDPSTGYPLMLMPKGSSGGGGGMNYGVRGYDNNSLGNNMTHMSMMNGHLGQSSNSSTMMSQYGQYSNGSSQGSGPSQSQAQSQSHIQALYHAATAIASNARPVNLNSNDLMNNYQTSYNEQYLKYNNGNNNHSNMKTQPLDQNRVNDVKLEDDKSSSRLYPLEDGSGNDVSGGGIFGPSSVSEANLQSFLGWPSMNSLLASSEEVQPSVSNIANNSPFVSAGSSVAELGAGYSGLKSLSSAAQERRPIESTISINSTTDGKLIKSEGVNDDEMSMKRQRKSTKHSSGEGHDEDVGYSLEDDTWTAPKGVDKTPKPLVVDSKIPIGAGAGTHPLPSNEVNPAASSGFYQHSAGSNQLKMQPPENRIASNKATIAGMPRNSSVENFWMLVQMGDLPRPDSGILSETLWKNGKPGEGPPSADQDTSAVPMRNKLGKVSVLPLSLNAPAPGAGSYPGYFPKPREPMIDSGDHNRAEHIASNLQIFSHSSYGANDESNLVDAAAQARHNL